MTTTKLTEFLYTVSLTREGNTWYAHADSGELLASGPGRKSTVEALYAAARQRGIPVVCIDGSFVDVPSTTH